MRKSPKTTRHTPVVGKVNFPLSSRAGQICISLAFDCSKPPKSCVDRLWARRTCFRSDRDIDLRMLIWQTLESLSGGPHLPLNGAVHTKYSHMKAYIYAPQPSPKHPRTPTPKETTQTHPTHTSTDPHAHTHTIAGKQFHTLRIQQLR